jgi:hypothetical protein
MLIFAALPHELSADSCQPVGNTCTANTDCCSINCQSNRCEAPRPWFEGIYLWVGLAVMISAGFIGLAYMAAQLFRISMMDAWVKIEIQELNTGAHGWHNNRGLLHSAYCVSQRLGGISHR